MGANNEGRMNGTGGQEEDDEGTYMRCPRQEVPSRGGREVPSSREGHVRVTWGHLKGISFTHRIKLENGSSGESRKLIGGTHK